jgi:hypothetical protein
MKKEKPSKKHHYLPRYYLKGFTDNDGGFFVYDKHTGKIFSTSPDAAFFENDLNTVELPNGKQSDFLEDLYTEIENKCWNSLDSIRDSTSHSSIESLDKMNLFLFLQFLYWRLPSNNSMADKLSSQFFREDNVLDYAKLLTENGGAVPKEVIERITNLPAVKKSSKVILPFAPFFKDRNWWKNLEGWRFVYTGDWQNWYIVGDNPIITRGESDNDPVNCLKEFIFPVSGKILLIGGHCTVGQVLPPEFIVQYSAGIIERAQRFVACQNKSFLEILLKYHEVLVRNAESDSIVRNLFEMLNEKGK